jgi:Fic family protein
MRDLIKELDTESLTSIVTSGIKASQGDNYRHWDEIRHRTPPEGMSVRDWWLAIKVARGLESNDIPLKDKNGQFFQYMMPGKAWERVHKLDQRLGGQITLSEAVTNPATRDRYLVSSLIEESINSSVLEGASTSRGVAKDMLRTGRQPTDNSERMIFNNYNAMNFVRENRSNQLTPELVCEIHRIVTDRTLDEPETAGRIQQPDEPRVKVYSKEDNVLYSPPPATELPERLETLCDFANGQKIGVFLHPVVRSIIVHFWLAFDHPFVDGNGRTARALFYWSMLAQNYWLAEYVTISRILTASRADYNYSFLYTETDSNDLTYFLMYQLKVLMQATNELEGYLQRKMAETKLTEKRLKGITQFNHRQVALLNHAVRHPDHTYTVQSHSSSHKIVSQTARTDLNELESHNLLSKIKLGRAYGFTPAPNLPALLGSLEGLSPEVS